MSSSDLVEGPHQRGRQTFSAQADQSQSEGDGATHIRRQLNVIEGGGQPGQPGSRPGPEGDPRLVSTYQDVLDAQFGSQHPESPQIEQPLGFDWQGPEAFPQFLTQL